MVIVPPEIDYSNTPFLWITDGDNGNDAIPDELNYNLLIAADIALQTKVDLSQETLFVPCTGCPVNWYSHSISIPDFSDCPIKKI